jgi:hypothetical protein
MSAPRPLMNRRTLPLPLPVSHPTRPNLKNCHKTRKTVDDEKIDASTADNPAIGLTSAPTNHAAGLTMLPTLAKIANQITHALAPPMSKKNDPHLRHLISSPLSPTCIQFQNTTSTSRTPTPIMILTRISSWSYYRTVM